MESGEQTRLGRFFDRHPLLLRSLAVAALIWGVGYLTWRVGWSGQGASPVAFVMLLITEIYGLWALGTLAWFSWSRPGVARPPATAGRRVDVYVCTYDEPSEVVAATLAGCRALTYPHTTYLLDDGRREEMRELAELAGARYLTRPDNWCRARTTSSTTTRSSTTRSAAMSSRSSTASSAPARTATAPDDPPAAVRSCRESEGRHLVGATILDIDPSSRMRLMEWCYVVCSHERLRGHRPAVPATEGEAIVLPLPAAAPQAAAA
jgi:hypothetical protein